jgi:hypothetical protein
VLLFDALVQSLKGNRGGRHTPAAYGQLLSCNGMVTMKNSTRRLGWTLLAALLSLTWMVSGTGCGGDDGDKSAEVTITSIEPESSYPGVATNVSFEIAPGPNTSADELNWTVRFGDGRTASGEELSTSTSHVYEASGTYPLEVVALAGGEQVGSASESVRILAPVDLELSATRGSPANVRVGDDLTVSFSATNLEAGDVVTPFDVSVYLTSSSSVTLDELADLDALGTRRVTAEQDGESVISAGDEAEFGLTIEVPDTLVTGDYHAVAWVNPEGQLSDTDPSNNFDVSGSTVRVDNPDETLADLAVTEVIMIPDRAFPTLNKLTRSFTIENRGSVEAFDAVARSWLSVGDTTIDENTDTLLEESDPFNIAGGSEEQFEPAEFVLDNEISPPSGEEIEVYLVVEVSLDDGQPEADLDNNVAASPSPTLVSDERVDGTDIVVNDFSVAPHSTFLNGTLEATLDIANEGSLDAGSFFCGIYLAGTPEVNTDLDPRLSNINISGLPSDDERTIVQSITVPGLYDPGSYYMYVVCDPLGALEEPYRSNNQKVYLEEITITDQADIDMFVEELDVPQSADEEDTVELTATICVNGSNPSGSTRGRLYRAVGGAPDFSEEPLEIFDIPNINPGDCEDVVIETTAACFDFESDYGYGVEVDFDDRLPESDEDNNQGTGNTLMSVSGEFCSCTPDSYDNDTYSDAFPISPGAHSNSVCSPESCDFYGVDLQEDDSLLITTTYAPEQGKLETTLFDPSGLTQLDKSVDDAQQEVAEFLVSNAGRYVVSVCGATTGTQNLYDLDVEVLPPTSGVDVLPRALEVPQRDAFSIGADLDISFRVYNIGETATADSFDAELVLSPNDVIGDSDDILLQPSSVSVAPVAGRSQRDVSTTVTIPTSVADGDYVLGVMLDINDEDPSNNWVTSKQITIETLCYDPLEPNDSYAEARSLSPGSFSNLVSCTEGDDYYELCVQNGKRFSLRADFDDSQGDIDLELYNDQFQLIDASANAGVDSEEVSVSYVNGDQCYYARAYLLTLQQTLQNDYDLTYSVNDVDPSLQCDGLFEPNNTADRASSLLGALAETNTIDRCPQGDVDNYYVLLSASQTVSFRGILDPANQGGTLRIQLYRPNGTLGPNKETAPGQPVAEIKDFTAPSSGMYNLEVTVSGNERRKTYSLEADGLGGIDLAADNLSIGPGTYSADDEVRFGLDISNMLADTANAPDYHVWLGDSQTHDAANDTQLGTFSLTNDLSGNSTVSVADKVFLPSSGLWDGTGYLHVVVEADNQTDPNPSNDVATTSIELSTN